MVEASHLPARQTLATLGIPRTTDYRWYDRWSEGGLDTLEDTAPHPGSVWNRLPDETQADVIEFALEHEDLTPRELAVKYTDEKPLFGGNAPPRAFLTLPTLSLNHRFSAS